VTCAQTALHLMSLGDDRVSVADMRLAFEDGAKLHARMRRVLGTSKEKDDPEDYSFLPEFSGYFSTNAEVFRRRFKQVDSDLSGVLELKRSACCSTLCRSSRRETTWYCAPCSMSTAQAAPSPSSSC